MAVHPLLMKSYANAIYMSTSRKFSDIPEEYVVPVKQYAAATFSDNVILFAYIENRITTQEYNETMRYKYPDWEDVETPHYPTSVQSEGS